MLIELYRMTEIGRGHTPNLKYCFNDNRNVMWVWDKTIQAHTCKWLAQEKYKQPIRAQEQLDARPERRWSNVFTYSSN